MKFGKKGMKRFGVAAVCAVLAAAVCLSLAGGGAMAYTSLPNIEDIVANQQVFNILEIVPAEGSGSMGYYVGGSEPSVSYLLQDKGETARASAATAYLQSLTDRGILSSSAGTAPLTAERGYLEAKPWQEHTEMTELKLSASEIAKVKGIAAEQAGGGYELVPVFVPGGGGSYEQVIDYFVYGDQGSGYYYYNVTFAPVKYSTETVIDDGTAIYANRNNDGEDETGAENAAEKANDPVDGQYCYVGTYPNVSLDTTVTYYTGAATGAPVAAHDANHPYAAVGSGFTPKDGGYFNLDRYQYVGEGKGNFTFTAGDGAEVTIEYATVWYSLGFVNNDWFKRYVFDRDNNSASLGAITVKVTTKTADKVTVADVEGTGMVVLSAGLNVTDGTDLSASYGAGMDISADVSGAITAANTNKKPIIVDWVLCARKDVSRIGTLAASLVGGSADTDHSFISDNLMCFSPFDIETGTRIGALATQYFHSDFSAEVLNAGFSAVLAEIKNENFLRQKDGTVGVSGTLPERVTLANSMRYIINFAKQRAMGGEKDKITVLELEPNTNSSQIKQADVWEWLGKPSALSPSAITIVTMSTAEFAGKIDDLAENYDLIYVGGSTANMNVSGGKTVYNDAAMNGLLYSNIGDKYVTNYKLVGMLDTDYTTGTWSGYRYVTTNSAARTFRFSGNDLTKSKADELVAFAEAGYPVVIADGVGSGTTAVTGSYTLSVNVTAGEATASGVPLTAVAALTPAMSSHPDFVYQWYRDGAALSTGTSITATEGHSYYCTVSMTSEYMTPGTVTAKSQTYEIKNGGAVIGTSGSIGTGSYVVGTTKELAVTLSPSGRKLTATVTLGGETLTEGCTYTWQVWNGYSWNTVYDNSYSVDQMDGNTLKLVDKNWAVGYYRCSVQVSYGGQTYSIYSQYYQYKKDKNNYLFEGPSGSQQTRDISTRENFTAEAVGTADGENVVLSVITNPTTLPDGKTYRYEWYNYSSYQQLGSGQSLTVTAPESGTDYYYCRVYVSGDYYSYCYTNYVTVKKGVGANQTAPAEPKVFNYNRPASVVINTVSVDYASQLYRALNTAKVHTNFMTVAQAKTDGDTLYKYLNLSKPQIVWFNQGTEAAPNYTGSYPTEYAMDANYNVTGTITRRTGTKVVLTYKFKISNATDATPVTTRYDCALYIDLNADGLYKNNERITDIIVHALNADGTAGALISPIYKNGTLTYELAADQYYEVSREMPSNYSGILAWKLEVSKNGADGIHDSVTMYSHITGEKKTIHVLQIMNDNGAGLDLINETNYKNNMAKIPDFNIVIDQIYANRLSYGSNYYFTDNGIKTKYSSLTLPQYLSKFDMVILGFNDAYRTIEDAAANAILDYSLSHAVLFTHDTTSIVNLPANDYRVSDGTSVGHGAYYWGYSFNTILRSRVGLDRYGVTDATLGRTKMYLASATSGGDNVVVQGALKTADISKVTDAGYTIAYAPKSVATDKLGEYQLETVPQVQGFGKFTLVRYTNSTGQKKPTLNGNYDTSGKNNLTKTVSQVNKGQITTYPFNLNTAAFGGGYNTLTVAETHEQYYQLNLNSDSIVVWYCLSGGVFDALPNDVTNSYYIYTMGNITYSGAGHSGGTTTDQEAKLFINTMVAAFRSTETPPTLEFKTGADGNTTTGNVFVTSDYQTGDSGYTATGTVSDSKVYFKISDPSLNKNRTMYLYLQYAGYVGTQAQTASQVFASLPIYNAYNDQRVETLVGGLVYYVKLSDITGLLGSFDTCDSVKLGLYVTTSLDIPQSFISKVDPTADSSYSFITVRKIGLFPLG